MLQGHFKILLSLLQLLHLKENVFTYFISLKYTQSKMKHFLLFLSHCGVKKHVLMQRVQQQQHSYGWLQRSYYYFEPISLTETEVPIMLAILLIVTVLEWWFFWQKGHVTIIPFLKRILACFGLNPSRHYLGPMKRIALLRLLKFSLLPSYHINLALIFHT